MTTVRQPANRPGRILRQEIVPLTLLAIVTFAFLSTFFNRFAGLRSGNGEFTSGIMFLSGSLPYRDCFSATPPFNFLKSALLLAVFGKTLFVSRLAGVVERIGIALLLYLWLRKLASVRNAFIAALVTIIVSSGDHTDPIASYNHDAILFAMLCGYAASFLLDADLPARRFFCLSAFAGIAAGFCLLTKQTIGLGVFTAVLLIVATLLLRMAKPARALLWIAAYLSGCATVIASCFLWLAHYHLVSTFLRMVFLSGPKAKAGSPLDFFTRIAHVAAADPEWTSLGLLATILSAAALYRFLFRPNAISTSQQTAKPVIAAAALALALLVLSLLLSHTALPVAHGFSKAAVYFVQFSLTLWFIVAVIESLRHTPSIHLSNFILFAGVAWSVAVMLSLSWPAFEPMLLPGLALLLIGALEAVKPRGFAFISLIAAVMVFCQFREKLDVPFSFDRLDDSPVRFATASSTLPELRHMRFSPGSVAMLDGTTSIIRSHTTPHDTIYTYPGIELLYELADRGYPTISATHNIDVVNDAFAAQEAQRLLRTPPAVIVYYQQNPADMRHDDIIWRNGQPSGQHILLAAVEQLTRNYTLAASYPMPPAGRQIEVYLRPSPPRPAP